MIDALKKKEISVEEAIESGDLPEKVLHMFACDCIERAIQRRERQGVVIHERTREALHIKRKWLEGRVDNQVYLSVWVNAWSIASDNWRPHRDHQDAVLPERPKDALYEGIAWALTRQGQNAANVIGFTDEVDRDWQRARFIWLLECYQWAGERMTFLIPEGRIPEPEELRVDAFDDERTGEDE